MRHQNAALLSKLACLSAERRLDIHLRLSLHTSIYLAPAASLPTRVEANKGKIRDGVKPELTGIPIQQKGLGVHPPKKDLFLESLIKLKYHRREMLPVWKIRRENAVTNGQMRISGKERRWPKQRGEQ